MPQVTFGELTVGMPPTDPRQGFVDEFGTIWYLTSHTGFRDSPPKKTSYSDRVMDEGSYDGPVFADQRVFVANYTAAAISPLEIDRAIETVRGNLSMGERGPVTYANNLRTVQAMVRCTDVTTVSQWGVANADFSTQLTASNPRMIDISHIPDPVVTQMAQPSAQGGVQFKGPAGGHGALFKGPAGTTGLPMGTPGPSGIVTLDNTDGSAPASILFTITGPVDHPSISTGSRTMTYQGTLGASDVLKIDTGAKTVTFNDGDVRTLLTPAQWFDIPKRSTLAVRFSAFQQNPDALMTATYFKTFY